MGCKDHPTAETVFLRARVAQPNISLGTVYRNLGQLAKSGEILTIETAEGKLHYDGDTSVHQHFICSECGTIIDVFSQPKLPVHAQIAKIREAKCVYYGICCECNKNIN